MAQARGKRFSIYDVLEDSGAFRSNPANRDSVDVDGRSAYNRADYPKMLYHPTGEERVIVPATAEPTPFGPKWLGEQRELIWKMVADPAEEKKLLAEGWHNHPAKAIVAGNRLRKEAGETERSVPPVSSLDRIAELEAALAAKSTELEEAKATLPENLGAKIEEAVRGSSKLAGLA